jgi:hypothetical protein
MSLRQTYTIVSGRRVGEYDKGLQVNKTFPIVVFDRMQHKFENRIINNFFYLIYSDIHTTTPLINFLTVSTMTAEIEYRCR